MERLEDSWVNFNFWNEKPFLSKCQNNANKFVKVPAGAARGSKWSASFGSLLEEGRKEEVSNQTNIAIHQWGEAAWVFASLASSLVYGGDLHGKQAAHYGKKYCAISLEKLTRWCLQMMLCFAWTMSWRKLPIWTYQPMPHLLSMGNLEGVKDSPECCCSASFIFCEAVHFCLLLLLATAGWLGLASCTSSIWSSSLQFRAGSLQQPCTWCYR